MRHNVTGADVAGFAEYLVGVAWESARRVAQNKKPDRRRKPSVALQPGPDTPVWNELVRSALPYLGKRGAKVKLARLLGVSRQRLHLMLVAQTALADAERTLLLLAWVHARRKGEEWV